MRGEDAAGPLFSGYREQGPEVAGNPDSRQSVHMIKLAREITPYVWVHPDEER
jgi:hypothetical protein